jgi:WD40 repeat protein
VTGLALVGPIKGHTGRIYSICFSPDSKQIVSCSKDETIRVWNAQTGVSVCLLSGHTGVCTVAFSQDGKRVASGSLDMTIRVWDVNSGELVLGPIMTQAMVYFLGFSPNGHAIVSVSNEGEVGVWDANTGTLVLALSGQQYANSELAVAFTSASHQCAISPNGKWIAAIDRNKKRKSSFGFNGMGYTILDSETGLIAVTLEEDVSHMCTVAFSPDSKQIITAHFEGNICRVHAIN